MFDNVYCDGVGGSGQVAMRRRQPMVIGCARTRDGRWRVYIHDDHTAELFDGRGHVETGRLPIYVIAQRLAELGIESTDLISD